MILHRVAAVGTTELICTTSVFRAVTGVDASIDEHRGCRVGFATLAGGLIGGLRGSRKAIVACSGGVRGGTGRKIAGRRDGMLGVRHLEFVNE